MSRARRVLVAGLLLLTLGGCQFSGNDLVDDDQISWDGQAHIILGPGEPVGQTFVARHGGLAAVEFLLVPDAPSARSLTLHLRSEPEAETDLAVATLQLPRGAEPGFYRFAFSPSERSRGQYYYAFLEGTEPGISLALGPGEAYRDGAAHQGHAPLDAQTAFRLVYEPGHVALDLLRAAGCWLGLLAAAGLLFVLPGWALLAWLGPAGRRLGIGFVALAAGLGLATYPLLFLWTDVVSLHLGPWHVALVLAASLGALAWRYRRFRPRSWCDQFRTWTHQAVTWPNLALLLVVVLVFAVRMVVVGTVDVPLWGDSYQHAMIVQLMDDHGGLFNWWEPYAPLRSFTYHFGFHACAAAFGWLTGLEAPEAVLWLGQILNGLAILALYPLAVRVSNNRWAGVVAVLVAGLLSPMPMTYTNWGRYTQLTGQVLLPVAVFLTWAVLEAPGRARRLLALNWIAVSGLALTHFRVSIFYLFFVLAWFLLAICRPNWRAALGRLAWLGLGVAVLCVPWALRLLTGRLVPIFLDKLTTPTAQVSPFDQQANALGDVTPFLAPGLWLLLVLAIGVGLWRRRRGVLLTATWWFLLLIAAFPEWLRLPGTGIVSSFALLIASYIPASLLIGDLPGSLSAAGQAIRPRRARWLPGVLALLLVLAVGLWGARARMGDVRPDLHALVTRPDVRAMAWLEGNTPQDSRFLVNSFFAYGGTILVGSDGGWWLPLLAGRENTVPPINYAQEAWPTADYRHRVHELPRRLSSQELGDPSVVALLRDYGITHIYVGQQQGRVNYGGPDVIRPDELLSSAQYDLLYHRDRVWVFEVSP